MAALSASPLSNSPSPPLTAEELDTLNRSNNKPDSMEVPMKDAPEVAMTDALPPEQPQSSFRDKLLNGGFSSLESLVSYEEICAVNPTPTFSWMEDPISGVRVKVPEVYIPKELHTKLCAPWKNAIIIKLLGKSINFFTLQSRLHREWKTEKDFDIIDVGLGYYVVRFYNSNDCQKILTGGPYKIFDHYLTIQPWEPNFQPAKAKIPKTAIWIHLESAPMEQFTGPILRYLASTLGKPIKVDYTTMLATRGKFARVCVEMDLSQTLRNPKTARQSLRKIRKIRPRDLLRNQIDLIS